MMAQPHCSDTAAHRWPTPHPAHGGVHRLTQQADCSPNEVLVVFGQTGHETAKLVHGGGTVVWPIIQDYGVLSLEPFPLEIPLHNALSLEKVRVSVPSVFTLAVGTQASIMQNAAQRLLDMDHESIEHQALEIITGQLRQVGVVVEVPMRRRMACGSDDTHRQGMITGEGPAVFHCGDHGERYMLGEGDEGRTCTGAPYPGAGHNDGTTGGLQGADNFLEHAAAGGQKGAQGHR